MRQDRSAATRGEPRPHAAVAPDGPPAVLADNTGFVLAKVHELARDRFEQALATLGLKVRHYGVLAALAEHGPGAQNALGDRLRIDRSTMVVVIDELERAGRVIRRRNPQDRRAYQVELTEQGRGALQQAVHIVAQTQDQILAPLDGAQREQLHATLSVLLRHLAA